MANAGNNEWPRAYVGCDGILGAGSQAGQAVAPGDILQFDLQWKIVKTAASTGKAQLLQASAQGAQAAEGGCPLDGPGSQYFTGDDCNIDLDSQEAEVSMFVSLTKPATNAVIGGDAASAEEQQDGTDVAMIVGIVAAVLACCFCAVGVAAAVYCCGRPAQENVQPVTISPMKYIVKDVDTDMGQSHSAVDVDTKPPPSKRSSSFGLEKSAHPAAAQEFSMPELLADDMNDMDGSPMV